MKKTRLLSILICLLALCLLVSCNSNANDETTAPTGAPEVTTPENTRATYTLPPIVTTAKEPKPEDMPNNEMLLVNGVNISSYKIVYNDTPLNEKVGSLTGKTIAEDIGHMLQGEEAACDFDYQSAVRLQQLIWEHYGYEIEIVSDTVAKDPSRYEIIIGATTRLATVRMKMGFVENQYVCALDNVTSNKSQFVICGGSYGATWHAIDKIEELIAELKSLISDIYDFIEYLKANFADFTVETLIKVINALKKLDQYLTELFDPFYKVTSACDGEDALQKLEYYTPDIIVSDLMMPNVDGVELCRRVKNNFSVLQG